MRAFVNTVVALVAILAVTLALSVAIGSGRAGWYGAGLYLMFFAVWPLLIARWRRVVRRGSIARLVLLAIGTPVGLYLMAAFFPVWGPGFVGWAAESGNLGMVDDMTAVVRGLTANLNGLLTVVGLVWLYALGRALFGATEPEAAIVALAKTAIVDR
jgi:hypothetical protein